MVSKYYNVEVLISDDVYKLENLPHKLLDKVKYNLLHSCHYSCPRVADETFTKLYIVSLLLWMPKIRVIRNKLNISVEHERIQGKCAEHNLSCENKSPEGDKKSTRARNIIFSLISIFSTLLKLL